MFVIMNSWIEQKDIANKMIYEYKMGLKITQAYVTKKTFFYPETAVCNPKSFWHAKIKSVVKIALHLTGFRDILI